jgi:hypothetical protein
MKPLHQSCLGGRYPVRGGGPKQKRRPKAPFLERVQDP